MRIKFGTDEGNSGAIVRWGKYLDNGIWFRRLRFRRSWFKYRFMNGYWDFGIIAIHWGN